MVKLITNSKAKGSTLPFTVQNILQHLNMDLYVKTKPLFFCLSMYEMFLKKKMYEILKTLTLCLEVWREREKRGEGEESITCLD